MTAAASRGDEPGPDSRDAYGQPPAEFGAGGQAVDPGTDDRTAVTDPAGPGGTTVRIGYGALLATAGFIVVLLAFTLFAWLDKASATFSRIDEVLGGKGRLFNGWARAYFGWLAWVLAGLTFLTAFLASFPSRVAGWFRVAGAVLAAVSIALTFVSIKLFITNIPSYSQYLAHARWGFYLALAGFLVMGVGAAVGRPRARPAGEPRRATAGRERADRLASGS